MGFEHIYTEKAPAPGPYSQAVLLPNGILKTAGVTGNVPDGKDDPMVDGGVGEQTAQTLKNLLAIVEAEGGGIHDITEVTIFLKDQGEAAAKAVWDGFNNAYKAFFAGVEKLPTRATVFVVRLPHPTLENTLVEMKMEAYIPQ